MCFEVDQDGAVATPFCPGKIVYTNHPWHALRTARVMEEAAQQGGAIGRKLHLCSQARTRLAACDGRHTAQQLARRLSPALVAVGKHGEVFVKRLARTGRVGATEAPRLDQQDHRLAQTGQALDAAGKPAVPRLRLALTAGTPIVFARRNQRDGDMLAPLLNCLDLKMRKMGEEVRPGHN
jgi:hypothetical protein